MRRAEVVADTSGLGAAGMTHGEIAALVNKKFTISGWWSQAKGDRSPVAVAHMKLPDKPTADRLREYWPERLDALGEFLKA